MLEVRRVERPRRQQHDTGLARIDRRDGAQGLHQVHRILLDGANRRFVDGALEDALGDQPVLDHVRHARRRPQVVLQHPEHAIGAADEIDARDRDAHAAGRADTLQLGQEELRAQDQVGRDHARGQDLLRPVDVVQEGAQGGDALAQALLDLAPFLAGDDPRHQADREDLLGPALVGVHREGDALAVERQLGQRLGVREILGRELVQDTRGASCMGPRFSIDVNHLVEGAWEGLVVVEEHGRKPF